MMTTLSSGSIDLLPIVELDHEQTSTPARARFAYTIDSYETECPRRSERHDLGGLLRRSRALTQHQ